MDGSEQRLISRRRAETVALFRSLVMLCLFPTDPHPLPLISDRSLLRDAVDLPCASSLHLSQPVRHGSRIKSDASADPERWNATSLRQLEDRDFRNAKQFGECVGCHCALTAFDAFGERELFRWSSLLPLEEGVDCRSVEFVSAPCLKR